MSTLIPVEVIAEALAKHQLISDARCSCGEHNPPWHPEIDWRGLHIAHQASVIAALPDIEIVPSGTSAAMGAFAAGSVTKQRVLEDIAYVLTGWRYEEPEDAWEAVAGIATSMGNGALVADVRKSYLAAGGES